ncbi:MAG: FAD-dependent oxidoreductase, partial [Planctomycetota bacterium]
QLRFKWDDFELSPQIGSAVAFPGVRLGFTNNIEFLKSEIKRAFPSEVDNFEKLLSQLTDYDDLDQENFGGSARAFLRENIKDPLLIEMILCPLMWYGNAREDDMDFGQFCIMFRSIFMEGFARPYKGVRLILKHLVRRYRGLGGELKLRSGVETIKTDGDRAVGVVLENGQELQAKRILSSAGVIETQRLCDDLSNETVDRAGQLTFIESISILDKQPKDVGFGETIVFYNDSEQFQWRRPENGLCDTRTGVICSPNNYMYPSEVGNLDEGVIRLTTIADFDSWTALGEAEYLRQKMWWYDRSVASAVRFIPDFRKNVIGTDVFTPKTIRRFTSHDNGAVYGAPEKKLDGTTHLKNLFLCGTDQGFVGIIGSIVSGISMANMHCLRDN